jgi:hypothetical protein
MSDPQRLSEIQTDLDAITPWPWAFTTREGYNAYEATVLSTVLSELDAVAPEIAEVLDAPDAKFIADSPERIAYLLSEVRDLTERIDKVLAVHIEGTEEVLAGACYLGDCDHEDACPPTTIAVCRHCTDERLSSVNEEAWAVGWPCPTVATLAPGTGS